MSLFKRKNPEEKPKTDIQDIKKAVEDESFPEVPRSFEPLEEELPKLELEPKPEKKPQFAPLFVKINRYNSVLDLLNDLKATVMMAKNAIVVQKEIERLAEENRKLVEDTVDKIDSKLNKLDSEFVRPKGFKENLKLDKGSGMENIVDELKAQVDDLKSELESIS